MGYRTTLNYLYAQFKQHLINSSSHLKDAHAVYREFRSGDVRHSLASIDNARDMLGYAPTQTMGQGWCWLCLGTSPKAKKLIENAAHHSKLQK